MYAYGIARHVRLEARRTERASQVTERLDEAHAARAAGEARGDEADERQWLRWAVTRLKPVEQEIILLLLDRELSYEAIGELLELPVGTIKSHVHRAKASLKELLARSESRESR
jgi:RNA polymerase sigma-70 factor (ECF subfamily)